MQDEDEFFVDKDADDSLSENRLVNRIPPDDSSDDEAGDKEGLAKMEESRKAQPSHPAGYRPLLRNPLYSHADQTCGWELCQVMEQWSSFSLPISPSLAAIYLSAFFIVSSHTC